MKKLIQFLVLAALVSTLVLSAVAQTPATSTPSTAASGQDDTEAKAALYKKFTDNIKTNPDVAYEAGKEYLSKYEAKDGPSDQYVKYIKKWVASYEMVARRTQFLKQLEAKDYNTAFASAKQVLVDYPDDLGILYELSKAGLFAAEAKNTANNADAVNYAKETIKRIQAGKTFEKDKPIPNKDETIGGLNYAIGFLLQKTQPTEALNYFINATQYEGFAKKDPRTYLFLGEIYGNDYTTLASQFSANCKTEEQLKSQACIDLKAKIDQVVDHLIDALARAIAYNDASPSAAANAQARAGWMDALTKYYKYRHEDSDAGLKELIASITSKPVPKPGEPAAPTTPSSTPSTGSAPTQPGATTSTTTPSNTTQKTTSPANTKQGTPATTTQSNGKTTTTQPTGKTSSTKTTPKRAHTRGKRN